MIYILGRHNWKFIILRCDFYEISTKSYFLYSALFFFIWDTYNVEKINMNIMYDSYK